MSSGSLFASGFSNRNRGFAFQSVSSNLCDMRITPRTLVGAFVGLSGVFGLQMETEAIMVRDDNLLTYADETVYRITITTSLDIPKDSKISRVQVSQGLPIERPWSEGEHNSSGRNIKFEPREGKIEQDSKAGATSVNWEDRVTSDGGPMTFTTTYETTSVTRELRPEMAKKSCWKSRRVQTDKTMNSEIVQQAQTLIKEPNPLEAFHKFTKWLDGRITYDATLNNVGVDDTLAKGGGHCGDYARIFLQFATAIGIPSRPIGGSNLNDKDGGANKPGFEIKPIWSNTHTWVELEIPGLGWVEAEPAGLDNPFRVPVKYVQNRGPYQNFRVLVKGANGWVEPQWTATEDERGGIKFVSDVGLKNVISFEVLRSPEPKVEESAEPAKSSDARPLFPRHGCPCAFGDMAEGLFFCCSPLFWIEQRIACMSFNTARIRTDGMWRPA